MTVAIVPSPSGQLIESWFASLYRDCEGWLTIFSIDKQTGTRHTEWAPVDAPDQAASIAVKRAPQCDVWFGVATRQERLGEGKRGGAADCLHIPAMWADIDILGQNHSATDLPPDLQAARQLLADYPLAPTATVHSGGGLQPYWVLSEPLKASDVGDFLDRWAHTWTVFAERHGWHIDNVWDVARVLRVPGTQNRKNDPIDVTLLEVNKGRRYGLDDLDQWMIDLPVRDDTDRPTVPYIGPQRPGDAFNAVRDGAGVLEAAGFTLEQADANGDRHYHAPGAANATGATVYAEDGHTTIWSETAAARWPTLQVRRPYDAFGLYNHLNHGGNWVAASDELARQGYGSKHVGELPPIVGPPTEPVIPKTLNLRWVTDVFDAPPREPDPLIHGMLRQGEMCVIGAPRAIGKSMFAMNMATLLGRGRGMLADNLRIARQCRVLYAQGELDEWESFARWYRMAGSEGPPEGVAETFDRWRLRVVRRRQSSSGADRGQGWSESDEFMEAVLDGRLEATIAEHKIDVLIIDPWAVYFAGSENSNDEVEAGLDKLRDLTLRYGLSVVIFHHIGKSSDAREPEDLWRGASRLADWASTRVTIMPHYTQRQAEEQQMTRQQARQFVDVFFLRRGEPTPDFSMKIDHGSGWWRGWDAPSRPVVQTMQPADVAERCPQSGWPSVSRAAESLGMHRDKASGLLAAAVREGLLEEVEGAHGGRAFVLPADLPENPPGRSADDLPPRLSAGHLPENPPGRSDDPSDQEF